MNRPTISVIIPVYNGTKTLIPCLQSITRQAYQNYEIIVIDNNSTDTTKEIIKEFQINNKNIRYAFECYRSRGAARNKGITLAKAPIIAMTDADCTVPSNWLQEITKPIRKENEQIVQGNEEPKTSNYWTKMHQHHSQTFMHNHCYDEKYIDHLDTKNIAMKKEVLQAVGRFNKYIRNLEDFELRIRLKKQGYQIYYQSTCIVTHSHKDSLIGVFRKRIDQSYWTTIIYHLHGICPYSESKIMLKKYYIKFFFLFIPWLLRHMIKKIYEKKTFELVTGLAWRIGIMYAIINKKRWEIIIKNK